MEFKDFKDFLNPIPIKEIIQERKQKLEDEKNSYAYRKSSLELEEEEQKNKIKVAYEKVPKSLKQSQDIKKEDLNISTISMNSNKIINSKFLEISQNLADEYIQQEENFEKDSDIDSDENSNSSQQQSQLKKIKLETSQQGQDIQELELQEEVKSNQEDQNKAFLSQNQNLNSKTKTKPEKSNNKIDSYQQQFLTPQPKMRNQTQNLNNSQQTMFSQTDKLKDKIKEKIEEKKNVSQKRLELQIKEGELDTEILDLQEQFLHYTQSNSQQSLLESESQSNLF